jgi:hypothetical protein
MGVIIAVERLLFGPERPIIFDFSEAAASSERER